MHCKVHCWWDDKTCLLHNKVINWISTSMRCYWQISVLTMDRNSPNPVWLDIRGTDSLRIPILFVAILWDGILALKLTYPCSTLNLFSIGTLVKILLTHVLMMSVRVAVCEIICYVSGSFAPVYDEVSLAETSEHPVRPHDHELVASMIYVVYCDTADTLVVGLDGYWWLWTSHILQGYSDGILMNEGLVDTFNTGLCCLFHYVSHD